MTRRILVSAALADFCAFLHAAGDPFLGAWKMNAARSTGSPGWSQTRTYAVDGDWWVVTIEVTDAAGKSFKSSNRYKADGKDYPWKGSDQQVDAISVTLPNDRTRVIATKKAGKVTSRSTATISKDGRTMTVKGTGLLPDGKPTEFTIVFEKQ